MNDNLELIKEIVVLGVDISTNQKEKVAFEFFPRTHVLQISIDIKEHKDMHITELSKSLSVNTSNLEAVKFVIKELQAIKEINNEDFLGD